MILIYLKQHFESKTIRNSTPTNEPVVEPSFKKRSVWVRSRAQETEGRKLRQEENVVAQRDQRHFVQNSIHLRDFFPHGMKHWTL